MSGHRDWAPSSEEHQPLTYWGGYAIYASHFIVAMLVLAMIATAIFMNREASFWMMQLPFRSDSVHHGQIWRLFSYGLIQVPDVWLVIDFAMLVWFGRDVEKHVGLKSFFWLYAGIYLAPPLVLSLLGLWTPFFLFGGTGALAVFVAFATLYPNVPLMFNILAKWAALILVGTYTLVHLSRRNYSEMLALWCSGPFAFAFIRHQQGLLELPRLRLGRRKPKLRVLPDLPRKVAADPVKTPVEAATMAEVDALLDKIAKSGIGSLTAKERSKLESAREDLMKRGAGRG